MRIYFTKFVFFILLILFPINTLGQASLFIYGTVRWDNGAPAAGLEMRLVSSDRIRAKIYTNQEGRYGFFDIEGRPSEYILQVLSRNTILAGRNLQDVQRGGRVDITIRR